MAMASVIEGAYSNSGIQDEMNEMNVVNRNEIDQKRVEKKKVVVGKEKELDTFSKCFQSIKTYMIPAKIAYLFNGARFEFTTYLLLFYTSTGLNPFEAGMVNGLQYLGSMIGNPLWGLLADKKGYRRFIMLFLCFMGIVTAGIQPYFAYLYGDRSRNVCPITNGNSSVNTTTSSTANTSYLTNKRSLFYSFLICSISFASFEGSINSFVDAAILERIQTSPIPVQIGKQRLFDATGASFGSLGYSASIQYFPHSQMTCFVGIFITYTICAIGTAISVYPLYKSKKANTDNNIQRENVVRDLIKYLKNFDNVFFFLNVLFTGIFTGVLFTFLFVFLKELNAPTMLFGLSMCLNTVSAVIIYSMSAKVIRFVGGPRNAMCVSCFGWAIRCLITSMLQNPYYVLVLDIFHGFTYSLSKVSALEVINETAPKNVFTTICGINNLLFVSCSYLIASIAGGKIYQLFGARNLYRGTSYVGFSWGCINIIYLVVRKIKTRRVVVI